MSGRWNLGIGRTAMSSDLSFSWAWSENGLVGVYWALQILIGPSGIGPRSSRAGPIWDGTRRISLTKFPGHSRAGKGRKRFIFSASPPLPLFEQRVFLFSRSARRGTLSSNKAPPSSSLLFRFELRTLSLSLSLSLRVFLSGFHLTLDPSLWRRSVTACSIHVGSFHLYTLSHLSARVKLINSFFWCSFFSSFPLLNLLSAAARLLFIPSLGCVAYSSGSAASESLTDRRESGSENFHF